MATTLPRQLALAEKHFRSGNHDFAEKLLQEILARAPTNAKANELLAYIAGNKGALDYSFELLKTATAGPGASAEAYYYLGKHFLEREQFEQAAAAYRQALRMAGNFFEGLHDLGVALTGCGNAESALSHYDQALALQPQFSQAWFNKGVALDQLKRFDEALQCYDKALSVDPGFTPAWRNRSVTLTDLGRHDEAMTSHDRTLALDPNNAEVWCNRGATLSALKRYQEALESHEKALTLNPQFAQAWASGATVFAELKYADKALTYYAKALALKPNLPYVRGDWLRARMAICQWTPDADSTLPSDFEAEFEKLRAAIDAGQRAATPFELLAIPSTPAQQRHCAEMFSTDRSPTGAIVAQPLQRAPGTRIKIGYFSPDFRSHPLSFLAAGLFECHDRDRFETHAFSLCNALDDPMAARVKAAFEHFHDVENLSDQEIASLAQSLHLDIAIDLAGHTHGARTGIFARRAAPVQVHYLGFPGTMGAPFIDYIFADNTLVPDSDANSYTEKVVYLPHCFQVNDAKRPVAATPTRIACGLPDNAFVFCSFNSAYKLNPRVFDVWMNILRDAAHSVLWLVGENDAQMQNLRNWAATRGISPQRLVFASTAPYAEHLARYALADLVLDTLPFNGHTSTSDALWGGALVLTCSGSTFAARVATSLLRAIGLDELVTPTLDAYQAKALHLAQHPAKIVRLKATLAANRSTHPLFNTKLSTRHIETAYVQIWQRHQSGLPPGHLHIAPLLD